MPRFAISTMYYSLRRNSVEGQIKDYCITIWSFFDDRTMTYVKSEPAGGEGWPSFVRSLGAATNRTYLWHFHRAKIWVRSHGKSINSYGPFGRTFFISNELICFTDAVRQRQSVISNNFFIDHDDIIIIGCRNWPTWWLALAIISFEFEVSPVVSKTN